MNETLEITEIALPKHCEACGVYSMLDNILARHHVKPVAECDGVRIWTNVDLAVLCYNCHKIAHILLSNTTGFANDKLKRKLFLIKAIRLFRDRTLRYKPVIWQEKKDSEKKTVKVKHGKMVRVARFRWVMQDMNLNIKVSNKEVDKVLNSEIIK